jgi:hypothetical protein
MVTSRNALKLANCDLFSVVRAADEEAAN